RILWRTLLESPAVALDGWRGSSLLITADGTMQQINVETGALGESWQVDATFTGAPIVDGDRLLFPTLEGGLQAVDEDRRTLLQTLPNVPDFRRARLLPDGSLAILTPDHRLLYLSAAGDVIDEAQLQAATSLGVSPEGRLLVYSQGGFWQVDSSGEWSLYIEDAAPGGASSALLVTQDRVYAFNQQRLYAYDFNKDLVWDATMPPLTGLVEMQQYDDVLLLTSNHGQIVLASTEGRFCNQTRIYGNDDAQQWHRLGSDGIMRFAIADQVLGLNWELFTRPCRS
ncbi:MAG: PQQ-binding-like beta-propeller repeat protein, partial [Anaerolineae bacterium]|nr:PQQ-binding-like beta-propeller repeat protein [Anaerolineae bacterium]